MQGFGSRTKFTLAVVTGTSVGLAILTGGWRLSRFLFSTREPFSNLIIKVARNEGQCVSIVEELKRDLEVFKVLGFDCEWVQTESKRKPVALVQLASEQGLCGLFQLHLYSNVPKVLKDLLEDREILKVGIAPRNDAKYLLADYGIKVAGTFDMRYLLDVHGKQKGGLAALVKDELGITLSKDFKVRVSNWNAEELSSDQEEYAAKDALASLLVFNKLVHKNVKAPFFSSKEDTWRRIYQLCSLKIDMEFKRHSSMIQTSEKKTSHVLERPKSGVPKNSTPSLDGKKSYRAFCPRKSPLYENAFMLAPDGSVLCTCDNKKVDWYVSKGLAQIVGTEPLKVQLMFEPAGRAQGISGEYYTVEKENQCVSCGRKDSYLRKKVVPHEYRRYFPNSMKKHQSHDVLLLCAPCHAMSNVSDLKLKLDLAELCHAPFAADENSRVVADNKSKMIRSAARALLNKSHQLPAERQKQLRDIILENYGSEVTPELLNHLKDIDVSVVNENYTPHGLLVVAHFARDGIKGLMKLEKLWREHFLNVMHPQHLPPLWSVDHYHEDDRNYVFDEECMSRLKLNSAAPPNGNQIK